MSSTIHAMRAACLACQSEDRRPAAWMMARPSLDRLRAEVDGAVGDFVVDNRSGEPVLTFMGLIIYTIDMWAWGWMLADEELARQHGIPIPHRLYTNADADRPPNICDENGDVIADLCRDCRQGEGNLAPSCPGAKRDG